MVFHMLTMVRDLLMLNQRLMLVLTLMPMLGMDTTDMALDHTDTEPMDMDTHTDMDTTEREMLMLSQKLRLMLMPTMDTMDTDSDHTDTEPMDMDTHTDTDTMVRGMLMLSQRLTLRLMLMLTMDTMDTELDTMDIHTDTDTGERSNFYCQNALNQIQPCFQLNKVLILKKKE